MNALGRALVEEGWVLGRTLLCWRLYAVLAVAAVLILLGYQTRPEYRVEIGGPMDGSFVNGFYAVEKNDEIDFRWTRDDAEIFLPGIGNPGDYQVELNLIGWRPEGFPPTEAEILLNGKSQGVIRPAGELKPFVYTVSRSDLESSGLKIELRSNTFSPPNDSRNLGVLLDSVRVSPVPEAAGRLVHPGVPQFFLLVLAIGMLFVWLRQLRIASKWVMFLCVISAAVLSYLTGYHRLGIMVFASQALILAVLAFLITLVTQTVVGALVKAGKAKLGSYEVAAIAGLFALAFVVRYGGTLYPQFLSSDITMHAHRLEMVMDGHLIFTNPLPDGTEAPYPPVYYLLLAPFGFLWADHEGLLKLASSLLDASSILIIAYILRKGGFDFIAIAVAGVVYAVTPYIFMVLSWGNHSNIFGAWASLLLLASLISLVTSKAGLWRSLALVGGSASLTFTAHYGSLLVSLFAVALVIALYLVAAGGEARKRAVYATGIVCLSLVAVYLLYYSNFTSLIVGQASEMTGGVDSNPTGSPLARIIRLGESDLGLLGVFSPVFLLAGLVGVQWRADSKCRMVLLAIAGWAAAAVIFGLFGRVVGMETRHELLLAPAVAISAGMLLSRFNWLGWAGKATAAICVGLAAWQGISLWFDRIMTAYH